MERLLAEVKSGFLAWRSQENSRRHISAELKEQALSLLGHYTREQICVHLEISKATLKNWLKRKVSTPQCNEEPAFVNFSPIEESIATICQTTGRRVQLKLMNGVQLELFEPSIDDVSALAQVLLSGIE